MRMVDIIEKKRDGGKLTKEEIEFFVTDMLMERFLIISFCTSYGYIFQTYGL